MKVKGISLKNCWGFDCLQGFVLVPSRNKCMHHPLRFAALEKEIRLLMYMIRKTNPPTNPPSLKKAKIPKDMNIYEVMKWMNTQ